VSRVLSALLMLKEMNSIRFVGDDFLKHVDSLELEIALLRQGSVSRL
jgi:hypothetical protein